MKNETIKAEPTYTCEMCKQTFICGVSEEDAIKEFVDDFGTAPNKTDCAIICDDCYNKLIPTIKN